MICVGIDVAKDKHDCVILNSEGKALRVYSPFPIMQMDLIPCCKRFTAAQVQMTK